MTRDSDTTFKVKRSRSPGCFTHRGVKASGSCSGERGNVLTVGSYCYVAVSSVARGASAPTEGGEGRENLAAPAQLVAVSVGSSVAIVTEVKHQFTEICHIQEHSLKRKHPLKQLITP